MTDRPPHPPKCLGQEADSVTMLPAPGKGPDDLTFHGKYWESIIVILINGVL